MKVELHILQNFAPSNLNRDDTGAPKDAEFGGSRRARISSQCLKRAVRTAFVEHDLLPSDERAVRTKRIYDALADGIEKLRPGTERALILETCVKTLNGVGLAPDKKAGDKTQYLLFLPERNIKALAAIIHERWDELQSVSAEPEAAADPDTKKKSSKTKKKEAQAAFPTDLKKKVTEVLSDAKRTPELALFGRMIADQAGWNIEAACQVAHALSTNRVSMEFDFYTAVDDLKPDDTQGADMMGTVQFNSACFYRYSVLDADALTQNLAGADPGDFRRVVGAYLRAAIRAIPTGKQSGSAAHNPPGLVTVVVRKDAPWSLANAFLTPARPSGGRDLMGTSALLLDDHLGKLARMYGHQGIERISTCVLDGAEDLQVLSGQTGLNAQIHPNIDDLLESVQQALGATQ